MLSVVVLFSCGVICVYSTPLLSLCQYHPILSNIFPINKRISVIWKQKARATSHTPAEAFPIMPVYRKVREGRELLCGIDFALLPLYSSLHSFQPLCRS